MYPYLFSSAIPQKLSLFSHRHSNFLHHSLPFSAVTYTSHATYVIGTLLHSISQHFQTLNTSTSQHFIFSMQAQLSCYAHIFTFLFSSHTFYTFLTPFILLALLRPPTSFSLASTKKWSDITRLIDITRLLLLYTHSHLTMFHAFVFLTTHNPSMLCHSHQCLQSFSPTCIYTKKI